MANSERPVPELLELVAAKIAADLQRLKSIERAKALVPAFRVQVEHLLCQHFPKHDGDLTHEEKAEIGAGSVAKDTQPVLCRLEI